MRYPPPPESVPPLTRMPPTALETGLPHAGGNTVAYFAGGPVCARGGGSLPADPLAQVMAAISYARARYGTELFTDDQAEPVGWVPFGFSGPYRFSDLFPPDPEAGASRLVLLPYVPGPGYVSTWWIGPRWVGLVLARWGYAIARFWNPQFGRG